MSSPARASITVNDSGEYIRHKSCDRRFYLKVHYDRLLYTLEPSLQKVGEDRENQWEKNSQTTGSRTHTDRREQGFELARSSILRVCNKRVRRLLFQIGPTSPNT